MRRNARSWGIKVALGLISLAFIFFLGGGGRISGRTQNSVATVGKEDISYQEFQRTQIRNESYFRNTYGDQLTPELLRALDIPSSTLSQLVNGALLRQEAARIGLIVPDESVREVIRGMDAFQRNGHFSPGIYRAAVERQGMTPTAFEYSIRNDILASQMRDLVTRAVHVTDEEAFQEFADDQEKVSLEYAKVESKDLRDKVKVSDEDLQDYFDHNAESFRRPETVKVRYIAYVPSKIAPNPEVSDERIEEYYQLNLETEFTREEEVGARHILKKVPEDADEATRAAARAAIEKIQQRLKNGEDFAKLAREESDDSSAANGGDLGMFKRGVMVAPFEEAAFSLPVGGVSDIIETRFGYHIIKVYAHQAAGEEPLAEVRDTIVKKLSADVAREKAYDAAIDDSARLQDNDADFDTVAKDRGIEIQETPLLDPSSPVPGLGKAPSFSQAAMGLGEPGSISEPVHEGDTYYLLQLVERKDSYIPELADVRDGVESAYRKQKAVDLARDEAESILAAVKGGKSLEEAAKAASATVESTDSFSHRGSFVPGLGDVSGLKDLAFRAKKPGEVLQRTFVHRDDAYVFALKKREPADRAKFEEDKQPYIDRVRQRQEQEIYAEFLRELKERTQISYNEQLLSGILKQ